MLVSRGAFYAAVRTDDVAVVAAYFAQDAVRAEVAETNTFVLATRPRHYMFTRGADDSGTHAWYFTQPPHGQEFLFHAAIMNRSFAVMQWFFSPTRLPLMGDTLALTIPPALDIAVHAMDTELVELLLTSDVFVSVLSAKKRQYVLNYRLYWVWFDGSDDVVKLLLAHGAFVNFTGLFGSVQDRSASSPGLRRQMPLLRQEGLFEPNAECKDEPIEVIPFD